SAVSAEPDHLRLGDQVPDGKDQAVPADHHAAADALGAEDRGGKGVVRHLGAQHDHRVECCGKVEMQLLGAWLQSRRNGPIASIRHNQLKTIATCVGCAPTARLSYATAKSSRTQAWCCRSSAL